MRHTYIWKGLIEGGDPIPPRMCPEKGGGLGKKDRARKERHAAKGDHHRTLPITTSGPIKKQGVNWKKILLPRAICGKCPPTEKGGKNPAEGGKKAAAGDCSRADGK